MTQNRVIRIKENGDTNVRVTVFNLTPDELNHLAEAINEKPEVEKLDIEAEQAAHWPSAPSGENQPKAYPVLKVTLKDAPNTEDFIAWLTELVRKDFGIIASRLPLT